MKTIRSKRTAAMLAVIVLFASTPSAFAYPPENAAVLYYKAIMLCHEYDEVSDGMLFDFWKGRIESNERIREYVEKNRRVIDIVLDASEIESCDWGLDHSRGGEVLLPPLSKFRRLSYTTFADARILALRGDYKTALSRCMSIYKMARHLNERPLIMRLAAFGQTGATSDCIIQILSDMPPNVETLTWLKGQPVQPDEQLLSMGPVLSWEREAGIISMAPKRVDDAIRSGFYNRAFREKALKRVLAADKQFFDRNKKYWNNYMDRVEAAFDQPYPQGYARLKKLGEELTADFEGNPDATLTAGLTPPWHKVYLQSIGLQTLSNAIETAIEIYIIKAKTGKLPDALPTGLPGDLFSGKALEYERDEGGFILRCRGNDLGRDDMIEYQFKVKK